MKTECIECGGLFEDKKIIRIQEHLSKIKIALSGQFRNTIIYVCEECYKKFRKPKFDFGDDKTKNPPKR